jgi:hypothetical protein
MGNVLTEGIFTGKHYISATLPETFLSTDKLFFRAANNIPSVLGSAAASILVLRSV